MISPVASVRCGELFGAVVSADQSALRAGELALWEVSAGLGQTMWENGLA